MPTQKQIERQRQKRKEKKKLRARQAPMMSIDEMIERGIANIETGELMPPGAAKMSDMLDDLVEPILAEVEENEQTYNKIYSLGMLAWNAAYLSPEEKEARLRELLGYTPAEHHSAVQRAFENLILRKLSLFPAERRTIVDFNLRMDRDGPYLTVISAHSR